MALEFDQFTNTLSVEDTVNANSSLNLTGQGTGTVNLKGTGQNLFLQSNAFTTTWASQADSATTGQTDPFGGSTAWTLLADGTSNSHGTIQSISLVSGITYTQSWYLKKGTNNFAQVRFSATFGGAYANFDLNNGVVGTLGQSSGNTPTSSITSVGNGWYRCTITILGSVSGNAPCGVYIVTSASAVNAELNTLTTSVLAYGAQLEIGSIANTYIPTTTTAVYGTPTLSFSGVSTLGLESNGSLFLQPAGTGALQAQATTSSAVGGNARGANAVDWQTSRAGAGAVASGAYSSILWGNNTTASGFYCSASGNGNAALGVASYIGGGSANNVNSPYSTVVAGYTNTSAGYFNFIGGGFTNSGTSASAVTTNTTTIAVSAGTTFYLSSANANIKAGQLITGTGISSYTYATSTVTTGTPAVMNTSTISGTTLTVGSLSSGTIVAGQVLTGTGVTAGTYIVSGSGLSWVVSVSQTVASTTITGTAYTFTISQNATTVAGVTLSFYTPHGVVVGGGNNQATGAYSFIGGGGDAGTAANRNSAVTDWSTVAGGRQNTAGIGTNHFVFIGGGNNNQATGFASVITGGANNIANQQYAIVSGGINNVSNGQFSTIIGGSFGTNRGISGMVSSSYSFAPIAQSNGITQGGNLILGRQTTDATATALASDSSAAGSTNQVIMPNNSAYFFRGEVVAGVTGGGNTKGWTIEGVIKRGANAASTTLVGSTVLSSYGDAGAATWTIVLTADTTNGGLRVTFTGQVATTIRTVAQISTTEMTY